MHTRSEGLTNQFLAETRAGRPSKKAEVERLMLNASIAFEYQRPNRLLSAGGLSRINEHFFLLREFAGDEKGDHVADFWDGGGKNDTTS